MDAQAILQKCEEAGVRLVRFLFCDNGCLIRGKATALPGLAQRLTDGIGLTTAAMATNSRDQLYPVPGAGPVGEVRLVPDPATFALLPYAPRCAALLCDMVTPDGSPWGACPRGFLKRVRERAAARGLRLEAAIEAEFFLARALPGGSYAPVDETVCFSTIGMAQVAPVIDAMVAALAAQGMTVEQYHPEAGHGQHEISIRHAEALTAADNQVKLRETVRGVAGQHGLYASFAPKPWPEAAGNGGHIHFSLWDESGRNVFHDPAAPDRLSAAGRQFLAGVLEHLPALLALTCPTVNSYLRLQPSSWSSAFRIYGHDNREAALRIASPFRSDEAGTLNLELKAADGTANPYLALGALLAAGLDGIDRRLDPGEPVEVDPATLTEGERSERGILPLPDTLEESVAALEEDPLLTAALGPLLAHSYVTVRRSEARYYGERDTDAEIEGHFYRY